MIRGLSDYEKKDDKKDKKKNTSSYAGGEKSGISIENPDDINSIIEKAKNNTQEMQSKGERPETKCVIKLFRNGFQVNEEPFREYDTPENKKFMKELNDGIVPTELRSKYPKGLDVSLEDRRKEEYVPPPPPKYIEYQGEGIGLGGSEKMTTAEGFSSNLNFDASKEIITIQIKYYDGRKEAIKVNPNLKVGNVISYIKSFKK